jgi:ubiquitin carboxyl-terminal hydrolase 34
MDLSIEKTNSAYMLFYERIPKRTDQQQQPGTSFVAPASSASMAKETEDMSESAADRATFDLSHELETWIWQDNTNFIQDNNVFDHSYFK